MKGTRRKPIVVYINWDGFADAWYELVNRSYGGTPHLNALLKEGVRFTRSETGIPSITGAMQQCIASGAWPADTGNCYRYYDVSRNQVIQFARHNALENIAEAAVRHGVAVASVNAWYFENRGTSEGDIRQPYIQCPPYSNFADRVQTIIRLIGGEPVMTGDRLVTFEEMPQLLSVYADDIDTVSHNGRPVYNGMRTADTRQMWYDNIAETIMRMDEALGWLVEALKRRGVYDRTTIVLTTDHGMAYYGAPDRESGASAAPEAMSRLADLAETVAEAGRRVRGERYKVEVLCRDGQQAQDDTEIVITVVTLQAQINFRVDADQAALDEIVSAIRAKSYYGTHLTKEQLLRKGAMPGFADLLISPKPPYHMSWEKPELPRTVGANHDSLDPNVRRIFTMMSGSGVIRGAECDRRVRIIDIAPTIARLLGFEGPQDAVGTPLDEGLLTSLRGPELLLSAVAAKPLKEGGGTAAVITGVTAPHAVIRVNRRRSGEAGADGAFAVRYPLADGHNRLVIEAEADGRITRRIEYYLSGGQERVKGKDNETLHYPAR
ncbi:Predicted pyrophosphatase or phosphodiesterase, AlkP superfamily [Paenibacillus sp. UNCCL117]|uniref:alkaline phosphatase family protein n=1 Tax=unclassified Paenibacillus TaxID=185978 RepID=UPI000883CA61|nr:MULTISPECIES: alkaline phosphatase family protein [unclassified Paenibacillus]SDE55868.1 Predicted pyrophosphatase or phosphodiesterase, AlkP superfamily [Paenibacillus sp. cl123]SFW66332.1 Predicted pyrophosphatase or phosphodiesterase, AlkP superfamily [Paenibacillus sp. UNCCL117]